MHPPELKEKVIALRKSGRTYGQIQEVLGIKLPKSTLADWCSGILLSQVERQHLEATMLKAGIQGRALAWIASKKKRESYLAEITNDARIIISSVPDKNTLKVALAMLYLGEGVKWKSHSGLMLGSSDPEIIKLYIKSLEICYGILPKDLHCRVSYRADQDIERLQKYWASVTNIQVENFYKTIPDPRTAGRKTLKEDYMGVCVIVGGGTRIQLELAMIVKRLLGLVL